MVVGYFAVSGVAAGAVVGLGSGGAERLLVLASGFHVLRGFTLWVFQARPDFDSAIDQANLALGWYALALVAITVAATGLVYRVYGRLQA
jgi:hypothetical protein